MIFVSLCRTTQSDTKQKATWQSVASCKCPFKNRPQTPGSDVTDLEVVDLLAVEQLAEVGEAEPAHGDHEEGVEQEDAEVDAPRLVPLELQEDLEERVDQKTFFPEDFCLSSLARFERKNMIFYF
jgi:hypothetical protein